MKVINKPNQFLTGAMYAPFCRTLAAPMSEWEQDIKNMADLGYNCLHGFAEWHDIEYEKGKFDFTQIDHMVDCAYRHGVTAIINVATQNSVGFYSPRWLMEECRENNSLGYVDNMGSVLPHSQFVVPCLDDPLYQKYAQRYLKEVAKHFAGDERVGGYVLWGEPLLFRPGFSGNEICYCEHTIKKFRTWLKERYKTIEALNDVWKSEGPSDFADFDSVYPPTSHSRQRGGFASWEDWKEFMELNFAGHIKEADRIFKENGALQPTVTEMTTGINQSIDLWKLARGTDIVGISCFGRPNRTTALYMSMATSMGKLLNKSTFVIEAGGGSVKFMAPRSPSADELKSTILQRAGYGTKGLMFWCWRPRMSDTEGNDFGLVKPNGKPIAKTVETGKLAKRMNELYSVYDAAEKKADIAIFMSRQINHIMGAEGMSDNHCNSLVGANFILSDLHINSDYIAEPEVLDGKLENYKTLILPCTYVLSEECAQKIAEFVKNGGQVIADYILAEKKPGGFCYYDLPGAGLDKVFGIDREDIQVIENSSRFVENSFGILRDGVMDVVNPITAKVLEEYAGNPAVTQNEFGEGSAVYFAGQFFKNYAIKPSKAMRDLLADILKNKGIIPYLSAEKSDEEMQSNLLTVALNYKDTDEIAVVTLTNSSVEPLSDKIILEKGNFDFVEKSDRFNLYEENGKTVLEFTLNPWESLAIYNQR